MPGFRSALRSLVKSDSGVTALEYGLILALIGVAAISAMLGVGDKLSQNFDTVVAAVADEPAPGNDPTTPGDDDGGPVPDPARLAAETPGADGTAPDNTHGENSAPTTGEGGANRHSSGETVGPGMGGANPADMAAASSANGASAANGAKANSGGGAGHSGGSGAGNAAAGGAGTSNPGAGQETAPWHAGPGEQSALLAQDSTSAASHDGTESRAGSALPTSAVASGRGGEDPSTGGTNGGSETSALTSALILLLWLVLGLGIVILGWKIALRTANKKDAEEQLEDWEPASFGQNSVAPAGSVH